MRIGVLDSGLKIVTSNLLGWYDAAQTRSYSGSGTSWNNVSPGSGTSGTLNGSPTFNTANGGNFTFNGATQNTDFGSQFNFTTQNFSLCCFMKINVYNTNAKLFGNLSFNNYGYVLSLAGTRNLYMITSQSGASQFTYGSTSLVVGNWYFLVGTRSGTVGKVYINAVDDTSVADSIVNPTSASANVQIAGTANSNYDFGMMMVYDKALTSTEITQNYNALKSRYGL